MSSPAKPQRGISGQRSLLPLMESWPGSWAGVPEDKPIGKGVVAGFRPFVLDLEQLSLSRKTVRRHVDNLWQIGGEIIRLINYYPLQRKIAPRKLILEAIDSGEAPWLSDATEAQQNSLDATARRLLRFLKRTNTGLTD